VLVIDGFTLRGLHDHQMIGLDPERSVTELAVALCL